METVSEEFLSGVRARLIAGDPEEERAALSGEVATRTTSLLRKAAVRWAEEAGAEPLVAARAPASAPPAARRSPRVTPALPELRRLLHLAWPWERAVLALALGGGLRESEIVGLRRRDLRLRRAEPPTHGRRRPPSPPAPPWIEVVLDVTPAGAPYEMVRRVRVSVLPRWACDLVLSPRAGLVAKGADELLFPHRSDPTRPRSSFRSLMNQIRKRDGGRPGTDPQRSLADLRRCWQRVVREAGAPREIVRQAWSLEVPPPGLTVQSMALDASRRLAAAWTTLDAPVGRALAFPGVLPRRAPKGCAPTESEKANPWEGWEQLPPSCR